MGFHLFRIEQQFSEDLLLQAEIDASLTTLEFLGQERNKFKFQVDGHTLTVSLNLDKEEVRKYECNCHSFYKKNECIHLILSLWWIRNHLYDKHQKDEGSITQRIKTSSIIDQVDERSLRQFLVGFARHNDEFKKLIKLFFQYDLQGKQSIQQVEDQLNQFFRSYRSKLNTIKHSRAFFFYIRSFIGVSEDLLMQKLYHPAVSNSIALFTFWNDKAETLEGAKAFEPLYPLILKMLGKLQESDISPELHLLFLKRVNEFIESEDYRPIQDIDLPELFMDWNIWKKNNYIAWLSHHLNNSVSPPYFLRALEHWSDLSDADKKKVILRSKEWPLDRLVKLIKSSDSSDGTAILELVLKDKRWSSPDLKAIQGTIADKQAYILDLLIWLKTKDVNKGKEFISYISSDHGLYEELQELMKNYSFPTWMRASLDTEFNSIRDYVSNEEKIKAQILSLPYYSGSVLKSKRNLLISELLYYAENHFGSKAREFLREVKLMIHQIQMPLLWDEIETKLQEKHAHRKSLKTIFN